MLARKDSGDTRARIIRSPALYLGELEVLERPQGSGGRWLSGTRLKALFVPLLHASLRRAPPGIAMAPVRLITTAMRLVYRRRNNALRLACERLCRIAAAHGRRHDPAWIYHQYLANFSAVAANYFRLYRQGVDAVQEQVELPAAGVAAIRRLLTEHGGVVLAVPHNVASAFSALRLNRAFPLLVVAKNPATAARTRVALETFERMQVQVLMVRGASPFELSRALFRALGSGVVAVATLDNVDRSAAACEVTLFGQPVGLARWAAKIAVRRGIPVVPAYFVSHAERISAVFGEPILATDVDTLVQDCAAFFECNILDHPASWAYLGDKHWQRVLQAADAALPGAVE